MSELGEKLRQTREEQGLSLADVEERTRIRRDLLEALENEDYSRLPEPVYVRGFVRGYAAALGLDPAPLLALVRTTGDERVHSLQPVLDQPLQQPMSGPRAVQRIFLGLLSCVALAAVIWWFVSTYYLHIDPLTPLRNLHSQPTPKPTATTPAYTSTPERIGSTNTPPALVETAPGSTPTPNATPTPTATSAGTASPTPTLTPTNSPSAGVEVLMRVDARTWVQVRVDSQEPSSALLEAGDDQVWQGNESIELVIGNAGGAYLTVNGEELGYLGAEGEVVEIQFGPSGLP